jgi:hypothetical protein
MNEVVLRTSTVSVIALAVSSALWLADSVQASRKPAMPRFVAVPAASTVAPRPGTLLLAALPADRAASAVLIRSVNLR